MRFKPNYKLNRCFLEKLHERVIRRQIDISWPVHSPDSSPLGPIHWGTMYQNLVRRLSVLGSDGSKSYDLSP